MSDEKIMEGEAVDAAETAAKETVNESAPAEEKADKSDKKKNKKLEAKIGELESKLADADKAAAEQND